MTTWFSTYFVHSSHSLHALTYSKGIPTNFSLLGEKMIRANEEEIKLLSQMDDVRLIETSISRPENISGGDPAQMMVRLCLGKGAGKSKVKPKAVQKQEVLDIWCKTAGVEKVYESDEAYAKVVSHKPLEIKSGVVDINVFTVQGLFKVIDFHRFQKAYNYGIGTRKSYGNGLIIAL